MAPPEQQVLDGQAAFLHALVRRLVPAHQVDDVVQDTWLAALRRPPRGSLSAWLARIARNRAFETHRASGRRSRREVIAAQPEGVPAPDELIARHETARRVADTVFSLEEPARSTLLLRFYDGLPPREIARHLDVPVATVRTRLRRTLMRLREGLRDGEDRQDASRRNLMSLAMAAVAPRWVLGAGLMVAKTKVTAAAVVIAVVLGAGVIHVATESSDGRTISEEPAHGVVAEGRVPDHTAPPIADTKVSEPGVEVDRFTESSALGPSSKPMRLVEVLWANGEPAIDAHLVVFEDDDVFGEGRTDVAGQLRLPVSGEDVEIAVWWTASPVQRERYPAGDAPLQLRLRPGNVLTGVVIPDRTTATEGMRVTLVLEKGTPKIGRDLPDPVRSALGFLDDGVIVAEVDASAAFMFRGLGDGWHGEIGVDEHEIRRPPSEVQDERLPIQAPEHHVVLQLVTRPVITGRVVSANGTAPVPYAPLRFRTGVTQGYFGAISAGEDGRFRIDVPPGTTRAWIKLADRAGPHEIEVTCGIEVVTDVGDVRVHRASRRKFLVTGWHGRPVENARCRVVRQWSVATGPDGQGTIVVADNVKSILFQAPGYRGLEVPVPPNPDEVIRCVLRPSNLLRLKVRTKSGRAPERIRVEIVSKTQLLLQKPIAPGASIWDQLISQRRRRSGGGYRRTIELNAAGDGQLADLLPRVLFTIEVRDRLGTLVATERDLALTAEEQRTIELQIPREVRTLSVEVRDASGPVLPGTDVMFAADGRYIGAETDDSGRVVFRGVYSEKVDLILERAGYVPVHRRGFPLPVAGRSAPFVMQRGDTLRVRITDAAGRPADVGTVKIEDETLIKPIRGTHEARGVYQLDGLQPGSVRLFIEHDGRELRRRVASSAGEVAIRLSDLR